MTLAAGTGWGRYEILSLFVESRGARFTARGRPPRKACEFPATADAAFRWTPDGRAVTYIDTKNGFECPNKTASNIGMHPTADTEAVT